MRNFHKVKNTQKLKNSRTITSSPNLKIKASESPKIQTERKKGGITKVAVKLFEHARAQKIGYLYFPASFGNYE